MEHNFATRDETFFARPFSSVPLFSLRQSRSSRKACFRKWNHLRQWWKVLRGVVKTFSTRSLVTCCTDPFQRRRAWHASCL